MYGIRIIHCIHVFLLVCLSLCDLMFRERGNVWLDIISFFVKCSSARKDLCTKVVGWFFIWFDLIFSGRSPWISRCPLRASGAAEACGNQDFGRGRRCSACTVSQVTCLFCPVRWWLVTVMVYVAWFHVTSISWRQSGQPRGSFWDFSYNLKEKRSI